MRPKTTFEVAEERASKGDTAAYDKAPRAPHCDPMVLHPVGTCEYCDRAEELQEERVRLRVSNTGINNRDWPCPSTKRRNLTTIHRWPGNQPYKES